MKKLITTLLLCCLAAGFSEAAEANGNETAGLDFSKLTEKNHPRLFITNSDLKAIKKAKQSDNPYVFQLHNIFLEAADKYGMEENQIEYVNKNGHTTQLSSIRNTFRRIVAAAYGYRATGNKAYLKHLENDLVHYCDVYPSWNAAWAPINDCEMLLSITIVYDWLYKELKPATRELLLNTINETGMDRFLSGDMRPGIGHNRNQVCCAALICAAIATYEKNPEKSIAVIEKAIPMNRKNLDILYNPDGITPEGFSYWNYGTDFQTMQLFVCQDLLGTDFGLGDLNGFKISAKARNFGLANVEAYFNYGDCSLHKSHSSALWYYALRYGDHDVLFPNLPIPDNCAQNRDLFFSLACAARLGNVKVKEPCDRLFAGTGITPLVIGRTGWTKDDAFFGMKGGKGTTSHGHMDQGSFVFESYGVRWATDQAHRAYQYYRNIIKKVRKDLGEKANNLPKQQNLYNWFFYHSSKQHNTLTVNDRWQLVDSTATLCGSFDTGDRIGGTIDMSKVYALDLDKAIRTACIVGEGDFEVKDEICVRKDAPAEIRFTWVSEIAPKIEPDGIVFEKNGIMMKLTTDAPGAEFRTWSSDPADYDTPVAKYEKKFRHYHICGYTYPMNAGESATVTTRLSKCN